MSTDTKIAKPKNIWIIALLVSIAINGLLVGLLLSKQVNPGGDDPGALPTPNSVQIAPNNPRHLVRILEPDRRRQVMTQAMKNLRQQGGENPRQLFRQLRRAKMKTMRLLRADELDTQAIEQSLAEIRTLNQKLAVSGDALMLEVLTQLTPEERKAAEQAIKKRENRRRRRDQQRR